MPKGHPGEGSIWPEYIPPQSSDSCCSCPALNAMANRVMMGDAIFLLTNSLGLSYLPSTVFLHRFVYSCRATSRAP
ncbi:hypothetical protein BJY52DRAFT_373677 [Lactarius psammicola]|nr:hypothetical protein BJY52DRAFT_373677 [Lactarius psammicola]